MTIKDIATLLGKVSLASVRQGSDLMNRINANLPVGSSMITLLHNGDDIIRIYYEDWPLDVRDRLDAMSLISTQESITLSRDVQVATLTTTPAESRAGWTTIVIGFLFVFVSLALVFYVMFSIIKDGNGPNAESLNRVSITTGSVIRAFFQL